jgi:hypothetical protein
MTKNSKNDALNIALYSDRGGINAVQMVASSRRHLASKIFLYCAHE